MDGYAGYHKVPNVTLVGCWAHARRGFTDALRSMPANSVKPVTATEGLNFCNQLFAVERKLKKLDPKDRYEERLKQSKPILDAFLSWLQKQEQQVLPKSALGKAIAYCLNQWDKINSLFRGWATGDRS
ncbi:transposase IS66 family protein [Tepidibacillus fermentans]|uniref:Transposase IS66 family protein n=1 Tax=Tepidibacillus fermentans TaxID=1281767 RepID=A0A4R3KGD2_9BACI|nr:transposase IS66 family protein [Tepidibacillus fermentans]